MSYNWVNTSNQYIIAVRDNKEVKFLNRIPVEFLSQGYRPFFNLQKELVKKNYNINQKIYLKEYFDKSDIVNWIINNKNYYPQNNNLKGLYMPSPKNPSNISSKQQLLNNINLLGVNNEQLKDQYYKETKKKVKKIEKLYSKTLINLTMKVLDNLAYDYGNVEEFYLKIIFPKINHLLSSEFNKLVKGLKLINSYHTSILYYAKQEKEVNFLLQIYANKNDDKLRYLQIKKSKDKFRTLKFNLVNNCPEPTFYLKHSSKHEFDNQTELLNYYKTINNKYGNIIFKTIFNENQFINYLDIKIINNTRYDLNKFKEPVLKVILEDNIYDNKDKLIKRIKELNIEVDNLDNLDVEDLRLLIAENISDINNFNIKENMILEDLDNEKSYHKLKTVKNLDLFEWLTVNSLNSGLLNIDSISLAHRLKDENKSKLVFRPLNTFK